MTTRFYFDRTNAPDVSPSYSSGWETTASALRRKLVTAYQNAGLAAATASTTSTSGSADVLWRQFVSEPMAAGVAFVVTDTVKAIIRAWQGNTSTDARAQLYIRVVHQDGTDYSPAKVLLDQDVGALASEFATSYIQRKFPKAWSGAGKVLDYAYTTAAGDRLVVEVGFRTHQPYSGTKEAGAVFGDDGTNDCAENETDSNSYSPWVEFSRTIPIQSDDLACSISLSISTLGSFGTDSTSPTELAAQEMISCLPYGDHLLVQLGTGSGLGTKPGDVIVSLDGDTFVKDSGGTNADIIWSLPFGNFLGPAVAPWGGEMIPYFFTESQLFALDFWGRKAYEVPTGLQTIKCACTWSDSLVFSDGYNVIQYIPGEPSIVRPLGLAKEQGFLTTGEYRVECLTGVSGGPLHAMLSNGTNSWMWEWTGAAWHPLGKKVGKPYAVGALVSDAALGASTPTQPRRFRWMFTSDLATYPSETLSAYRIADPEDDPNPLVGTATFDTGAVNVKAITTPWIDAGFKELDGAALQMWFGGTTPTGTTVVVEYQLNDDETTWYTLGNFDGGQDCLNFGTPDTTGNYPGTEFRTIRFRFALYTTVAASTPNALPMTFVFRKKPSLRMSYLVNIDATREARENEKTMATLISELAIAWNTKTLVRFYYPARNEDDTEVADGSREVDKRVDIVSMPTRESEIRQAQRRGIVTVQVMEPASWGT